MGWEIMLLLAHLPFLFMAIALYRRAPCWMQKWVMAGFITAMALVCVGYVGRYADEGWGWLIMLTGLIVNHLAVMLLLWRLTWQNPQWILSPSSPSSSPR